MREILAGLYAITPSNEADTALLIHKVALALRGGARLIQYRDKSQDHDHRQKTARQLLNLTRHHDALLIINDDVELATAIGADGVHLGEDDADISIARTQLGPDAIIGKSCYNQLSLAKDAARQGADYIAFGRFFPSRTKPGAIPASLALLQQAKREIDLPVAVIGGINSDNAATLITAGADMLAMVDGVFAHTDIQAAAQNFQSLFKGPSSKHVSA